MQRRDPKRSELGFQKLDYLDTQHKGGRIKPAAAALRFLGRMQQPLLLIAAACVFYMTGLWLVALNGFIDTTDLSSKQGRLLLPGSWAGAAADGTSVAQQNGLLLATHNRLLWYYPLTDSAVVLHEGEGVHYGMFPGEQPGSIWSVIRPHNWHPETTAEHLVQFDAESGAELQRVQIPSRFSHDAIRVGDSVYVCSTGDGSILELSWPDMAVVRRMQLFSTTDHPNTLAAAGPDHLYVMLHNLGESDLVKVYVGPDGPAREVSRLSHVGRKAHGLVAWGSELVLLDSDRALLVSINPLTKDAYELWGVPEEGKFLKGLAVLDDVAYFGITTWAERSVRDDPGSHGELAAFDLLNNKLLWRRTVPTAGLLNTVGAPHLAFDSTYSATYTLSPLPHPTPSSPVVLPDSRAVVSSALRTLSVAGYPPQINPAGYWSSGWPRLDQLPKLINYPEAAGLALPLFHANISALKTKLLEMPAAMWSHDAQATSNVVMTGRSSNMERFKPGVEGIVLLFSDNLGQVVYEFPYYSIFKAELEPLLLEILGPVDFANIIRLQLALMKPGTSDIKMHRDSGGYAKLGHRIHVPVITHSRVTFDICPTPPPHPDAAAAADVAAQDQHSDADAEAAAGDVATRSASQNPSESPRELDAADEAATKSPHHQHDQHAHPSRQLMRAPHATTARTARQASADASVHHGDRGAIPAHAADVSSSTCVTIQAQEGLVFELNNHVPHKVANPGPGPRVHLVVDVFEEPKTRTRLPPGSSCQYGSPGALLQQLAQLTQEVQEEEALAAQVQSLLGAAGMSCVTKEGQRIMPKLPPSSAPQLEQAGQELLAALNGMLEQHEQGQLDVEQLLAGLKRNMQGQPLGLSGSRPSATQRDPEDY